MSVWQQDIFEILSEVYLRGVHLILHYYFLFNALVRHVMSTLGLQGGTSPGQDCDTTLSKLEHIEAYSWIVNSGEGRCWGDWKPPLHQDCTQLITFLCCMRAQGKGDFLEDEAPT